VDSQDNPTAEPNSPAGMTPAQSTLPASASATRKPMAGRSTARAAAPDLDPADRTALQGRDSAVLGRFYDVYFDQIYGYVRRLVREEHLAEDLTQDIFMHLYRSMESYDPTRELRPWVFTIATNKVRDHWRSRRHAASRREVAVEDQAGMAEDPQLGPGEELIGGELADMVAQAIDELPEIMKTTLTLRYYEGLSFAEIGVMVERNEVAVRKRYSRALEELRKRLAPVLEEGAYDLHVDEDVSR
jgi:RNA polymerase sigma-70 factor (ECF subfamily)